DVAHRLDVAEVAGDERPRRLALRCRERDAGDLLGGAERLGGDARRRGRGLRLRLEERRGGERDGPGGRNLLEKRTASSPAAHRHGMTRYRSSQFAARSSQFAVRSSQFEVRSSQFAVRSSKFAVRKVEGRATGGAASRA